MHINFEKKANYKNQRQRAFSKVGTPDYIAPETLLDGEKNKEADIWALGIILYEMIYGIPPFYNEDKNF